MNDARTATYSNLQLTGTSCLAEGVVCYADSESLGTCCSGTTCEMMNDDMDNMDDMMVDDGNMENIDGYIMDMRQNDMDDMGDMKYCISSSTMTSYDMKKAQLSKTKTTASTATTTTTTTTATPVVPRRPRPRPTSVKNILTDRCWEDCELTDNYVSNPACLLDCFPAHHCLTSLLLDYTGAGGVCGGTFISQYYPGLWPTSDKNCTFLQETDQHFTAREEHQIEAGICSATTEALLQDQKNCIKPLLSQTTKILGNIQYLIWSTCSWQTFQVWKPKPTKVSSTPPSNSFHRGINQNIYGKIIF